MNYFVSLTVINFLVPVRVKYYRRRRFILPSVTKVFVLQLFSVCSHGFSERMFTLIFIPRNYKMYGYKNLCMK